MFYKCHLSYNVLHALVILTKKEGRLGSDDLPTFPSTQVLC